MQQFKKTPIFAIYTPPIKGRTYDKTTKNFRALYDKGGVYTIFKRDSTRKVRAIYTGSSTSSAAKSCLRHFYFYNDAREREQNAGSGALRVSFENEKSDPKKFFVMFVYIDKPAKDLTEAERKAIKAKETELINKLEPKFNTNQKTGEIEPDIALRERLEAEARSAHGKYNEYAEEYERYYDEKEEAESEGHPPPPEPPF